MNLYLLFAPLVGFFAVAFAIQIMRDLLQKGRGTPKMVEISDAIRTGAHTYLARQFLVAGLFATAISRCIELCSWFRSAIAFSLGAVLSGLSAYIGMRVAIFMNARTANAACTSFNESMEVATKSGTVVGLSLTGIGLLGVGLLYVIVGDPFLLLGLGFGASLIGLFARVGGGIYTKAADIGADLVGKIEEAIPEDDPRNAAVIADQVGDNVGDIAGTGSDVFQSYIIALVAAMILGLSAYGFYGVIYPLAVAAVGLVSSLDRFVSDSFKESERASCDLP